MNIARQVATRSTCPRKHVGAVIVRDRTILSTGYNGSIRGLPHCSDVGCLMEDGHCVATVHAEANAIIQAAKNGVAIDGAEIYTTASPCWPCFKLIANSGLAPGLLRRVLPRRAFDRGGEVRRHRAGRSGLRPLGVAFREAVDQRHSLLVRRAAKRPARDQSYAGTSPSARIRRHSSRFWRETADS